jgi:hypothetical protein
MITKNCGGETGLGFVTRVIAPKGFLFYFFRLKFIGCLTSMVPPDLTGGNFSLPETTSRHFVSDGDNAWASTLEFLVFPSLSIVNFSMTIPLFRLPDLKYSSS